MPFLSLLLSAFFLLVACDSSKSAIESAKRSHGDNLREQQEETEDHETTEDNESTEDEEAENDEITEEDETLDESDEIDVEVEQTCVDIINDYRATIGLFPLDRWYEAEVCSSEQAQSDAETNTPHGAFGQCGEFAQNECPNWPGPPESMIGPCLAAMWAEGPGEDYALHGHYLNMTNPSYTKVACGFFIKDDGRVWAIQNFR